MSDDGEECCCLSDVEEELKDFFESRDERIITKQDYNIILPDNMKINTKIYNNDIKQNDKKNQNVENNEKKDINNNKKELYEIDYITNKEKFKVNNDYINVINEQHNNENQKTSTNEIYLENHINKNIHEKKELNEINLDEEGLKYYFKNKKDENENFFDKSDINEIISNKENKIENQDIKENIEMNKTDNHEKMNKNEKINKNAQIYEKNNDIQKDENNIEIISDTKLLSENKENNNIIIDNNNLEKNKDNNINISININGKDNNIQKKEQFKKSILFDRDELYVNLIHFDYNMTNRENYIYYNNFKVDVVGGFHAIDDLVIFKNYLESLNKKNIPFIVISSGSSGKDVIPICKKFSFIKEVIIFCNNYKYNEHYLKEYPGYVKKILTSIKSVYEYLKTLGGDFKEGVERYQKEDKFTFSSEEIQTNKQLKQCPVITAIEYDRCGYLVHKVYSSFFGDINDKNEKLIFDINNLNKIYDCLDKMELDLNEKRKLSQIFNYLFNLKDNDTFVEESIRAYTGESIFCYLFNRIMRNFEKGLISFAYYMGPLLYGLNKYVKENKKLAIEGNKKLYRIIECSNLDFYLYKLNVGHIICFPSFTSTSSKEIKFQPSKLSKNINNNIDMDEKLKIKMIFKYKYKKGNISPGIIIEKNKGKDGRYLSNYAEKEVLLFPFTFVRIKKIKSKKEKGIKIQVIELEIINRTSYIEYILKTDDQKRIILFSKLD